jgi:hypothetical protein
MAPKARAAGRRSTLLMCKVAGNEYLHIVKAINGERFQIGNNRGFINGWIGPSSIYGKCIRVER